MHRHLIAMMLSASSAGGGGGGYDNTDTAPPDLGGGTGLRLYVARGHGLYTDLGTTLVTAAGQSIRRWKDYSGNNNHADQTDTPTRPLSGANAQCMFDAAVYHRYFVTAAGTGTGITDGELFCLLKTSATSNGLWAFGGGDLCFYPLGSTVFEGSGSTGRYSFPTPSGLSTYHVWHLRTSGATWEALKNNTVVDTRSGNTPSWGSNGLIGANQAVSAWFTGEISAVALYDGARSSGERSSIVSTLLGMAPP